MDTLQACAKAFENLLPIKYRILIGRKGKAVELTVGFEAVEFHHFVGLHKLHDLRIARANREKVFSQILSGDITLLTKKRRAAVSFAVPFSQKRKITPKARLCIPF